MNAVLNWVKTNVYIVIFVVIMIAFPVVLTIIAGQLNAGVRETVKTRAAQLTELKRLEKTQVTWQDPVAGGQPVNASVLVNPQLLERYRRLADQVSRDAQATREAALEFNRKGRGVLLEELFPQPPVHRIETLPFEMYRVVMAAYDRLLEEIDAGTPPATEALRDELEAARDRYRTQVLIKSGEEQLTAEEDAWLTEQLTKTRLSMYADAANDVRLYVSPAGLEIPTESETPVRAEGQGLVTLFEWQWQYWIKHDILKALARANASADSVIDAPVKRVVSLRVVDPPVAVAAGGGGAQQSGGGFGLSGGGGIGKRGAAGSRGSKPADAPRGPAANPGAEVRPDYGVSFTGRTSNPLYDVRFVQLVVVADTQRIPELFDALASENFITVTDVRYDAVDPFAEAAEGYFYGGGAVSMLTLELETVWLREWTAPFMPPDLKAALGVPEKPSKG